MQGTCHTGWRLGRRGLPPRALRGRCYNGGERRVAPGPRAATGALPARAGLRCYWSHVERIGFVGAGRAGSALARALAAVGWPVVAVASRTPASATRLAAQLPAARALPDAQAVADAADLVFLTVPDSVIGAVAETVGWRPHQAVVHTSGVDSLAPLAAARRAGALIGGLHPLQTFAASPSPDPLAPFADVTCALDADPALLPRLEALVRALGARP